MSQKGRIFREEASLPSLLEIAERTHRAQTGSYSAASEVEIRQYVEALQITLDDWEPSRNKFEDTIRVLCCLALEGGKAYLKRRV